MNYIYKSATELASLIREGRATSTDIVQEHLNHIKKYNPAIQAIIIHTEEEALKTAALCDEEAKKGVYRGALHGVPVTIKESFWLKGTKSTSNSWLNRNFMPSEDALVVQRMKEAGAVILGKTNVPRNLLDYQVSGDLYPEGKNPYHHDFSPGGSTGGGAAALAAGFTPLELGTDFGGSIRVPANFCGVYGLKPTEGTVSLHGNFPLSLGMKDMLLRMSTAGPLARSVEDLELLWKVIVGPDIRNRTIAPIAWKEPSAKKLKDYHIAWTADYPGYTTSFIIQNAIADLIQKFQNNGGKAEHKIPDDHVHWESARLFVSTLPFVLAQQSPWIFRPIMKWFLRLTLFKRMKTFIPDLNRSFRLAYNRFVRLSLERNRIIQIWETFFETYDFFICPIAFGPAYKRCKIGSTLEFEGQKLIYADYVAPYVVCFNASGHPAISIPLGLNKDGLPIGVQIVGPYWSEPELLHFAKELSTLTPGFITPHTYTS